MSQLAGIFGQFLGSFHNLKLVTSPSPPNPSPHWGEGSRKNRVGFLTRSCTATSQAHQVQTVSLGWSIEPIIHGRGNKCRITEETPTNKISTPSEFHEAKYTCS